MSRKIQGRFLVIFILMFGAILISPLFCQTASYSYDAAGRLTLVSYGNGVSIRYDYDAAGNLTRVTNVTVGPPSEATLISPSGATNTNRPTYKWNNVASATYYQLYVNDGATRGKIVTWYTTAEAGCSSGICFVTPDTAIENGSGEWWIQTWNDSGYGPWSEPLSFTIAGAGVPGKATLVSPSGSIGTNTPTYVWNAVSGATWYFLWVNDSIVNSGKIQQWYTAAEAGCSSGAGNCSVTPSTILAGGAGQWWIQTWNDSGYGPWSDSRSFTVTSGVPGKATLVSPSGNTGTRTPTYIWNAVPGATWYFLWVNDSAVNSGKIQKWYTAAETGCSSGTGNCSVTPSVALADGAAQWWIQTWNDSGYGPWSESLSFTVSSVQR